MRLTDRFNGVPLSTNPGVGIFFDKAGETTPIVFSQFVLKLTSMPEVIVFFHLRPLETPSVPVEDRYTVSRLAIPNCYRLVVRYGYNDEIMTPNLASTITDQVRRYLIDNGHGMELDGVAMSGHRSPSTESQGESGSEAAQSSSLVRYSDPLNKLERACVHSILYITGKEQMRIKKGTNMFRGLVLWIFLWIRDNTRAKIASLGLEAERVIEVGFLKDI